MGQDRRGIEESVSQGRPTEERGRIESSRLSFLPESRHVKICSTNPIERLNREIKRRTDAVGVFPDVDSILRLVGTLLLQQNRQWQHEKHYLDPGAIRPIVAGA